MFCDCITNKLLTCFGAHILVVLCMDYVRVRFYSFNYSVYIYCCRDVTSAPTYEYANSLQNQHSLLLVFTERCRDSLLREIRVKSFGNPVR